MKIDRSHFFVLAVIGIFTGMLAPSVSNISGAIPYAFTNTIYGVYGILLLAIVLFFSANIGWNKAARIIAGMIIAGILTLGVLTLFGLVRSFSGEVLGKFSWGWIFLGGSMLLLFFGIFKKPQKLQDVGEFFRIILGIAGTFSLTCIFLFIMYISYLYSLPKNAVILEKTFGSGAIESFSGGALSPAFSHIYAIDLQRKKDNLYVFASKNNDAMILSPHANASFVKDVANVVFFGDTFATISVSGSVSFDGVVLGTIREKGDNFLVYTNTGGTIGLLTEHGNINYKQGNNDPKHFRFVDGKTRDDIHLWWVTTTNSGSKIVENGTIKDETYHRIIDIQPSNDGKQITLVSADTQGKISISQDGKWITDILPNVVPKSIRISGKHSIYAIRNEDASISLVYDGVPLDYKLEELREIFLDSYSHRYTFFGRLQGKSKYCIFTQEKENLCDFDAYMNPFLQSDGSGVIFAGLKDNVWGIYRNITKIVSQTNYVKQQNLTYDYFFADTINPKQYVFIIRSGDKYTINKQGKNIDKLWNDIDVHSVHFNYDGKVLLSVQDQQGWKILEI